MISVVILTYNSRNFIKPCLDSVFAQNYQDFEVIVVDNGSKDGTVDIIKKDYPSVNLIENKENLGAAKARNQGIEIAKGDWILTLDCDTVLERNFFSVMLKAIKSLPQNIRMIQPKILMSDKKTIYSCGIYLSRLRRFYDIGKGQTDLGQFSGIRPVFGACSAAAIYNKEMLEDIKEKTGYFDERFFFLVEDVDLSWRAKKRGWRAIFCPKAISYHFGNSSGYDKTLRKWLCFRNRYYLIKKNEGFKNYLIQIFPFLIYDLPRFIYFTIKYKRRFLRKPRIKLSHGIQV